MNEGFKFNLDSLWRLGVPGENDLALIREREMMYSEVCTENNKIYYALAYGTRFTIFVEDRLYNGAGDECDTFISIDDPLWKYHPYEEWVPRLLAMSMLLEALHRHGLVTDEVTPQTRLIPHIGDTKHE